MKAFLLMLLTVLTTHAADRPPNVVIIFCDDLGYADIGPFGQKSFATPNLDRMAAEGRCFTNFHVSSAVCSASRSAILTGCYHSRVGIHGALGPSSPIGLNPGDTTIAEMLKQKNYATGMAGKWHLGAKPEWMPTRRGFDEWLGLPYSNDMWPHCPEAKPGAYPDLPMYDGEKVILPAMTHEDQNTMTTRYTERSVAFIEKNKDRPFFFYLAHNMPHVPLHVSAKFAGKSGAGLFGDVIQEIDWSVGEVLAALKRAGVDEHTLVIFTSDNGPWLSYGDHAGSAGPLRRRPSSRLVTSPISGANGQRRTTAVARRRSQHPGRRPARITAAGPREPSSPAATSAASTTSASSPTQRRASSSSRPSVSPSQAMLGRDGDTTLAADDRTMRTFAPGNGSR